MPNDVSYFKVPGDSTTYQFNDPDAESRIGALESTVNDQAEDIADNTTAIGTLSNLATSAKGSLVAAINEVDSHADTNTSNIATNASAISQLNSKISGFAGTGYISIGSASGFNISYSGGGNAMFFLFAMNRRNNATPFSAVVQKYSGGTNYSVLGGTTGSFTTSAISTGIAVTMPDTYFDVIVIGSIAFTLSI